jgi:hypothetical protein
MTYAKPEVTLLANAARAIQNPSSKAKQQVRDAAYPINMELASAAAYAADE